MGILKLKPACKDYLWGGHRLVEEYGKEYEGDILAETWELSCHSDGPSVIANGVFAGDTLEAYIEKEGREVLGTNCRRFRDFPILIKFIDAKQNLSIQVHPNNRYALKNEGQYGKTEMWYVMDAGEDAFLYYGFKREITKEEFEERIKSDTLLEVLNAVPVQKGDVLFIESGTIHAIGENILIAEIQQNSNVTYRVYDYGRVGKDGKKRDLHIEKALAVTNRVPMIKNKSSYPHIADCDYFTVDKLNLDGRIMRSMEGYVTDKSFASILILDGEGTITSGEGEREEKITFRKGDSLFLPAGMGSYKIEGSCDALITTIREKAGPVRVGVDIGGTHTRIGIVDVHQKLVDSVAIATNAIRGAEAVMREIGEKVNALMEKNEITYDQCVGVGIGIAGTVDSKQGVVRYSNNIGWKNIPLKSLAENLFPVPVEIANNADCAALGETVAGAGRECQDIVMLTVGTGVGGGVIVDGNIYRGKGIGGSELGHMVIAEGGELCTCGNRGCLEAYVSIPALHREAKKVSGREMTTEEIFESAAAGDIKMQDLIRSYTRRLGAGLTNIVNIFRPQMIILGGEISQYGDLLVGVLQDIIGINCFGGADSDIADVAVAELGSRAGIIGAASLV